MDSLFMGETAAVSDGEWSWSFIVIDFDDDWAAGAATALKRLAIGRWAVNGVGYIPPVDGDQS